MSKKYSKRRHSGQLFRTAAEDLNRAKNEVATGKFQPQMSSPSFALAFADDEFMLAEEQRGVRLMLELSKPEQLLRKKGIMRTVVIFGSARTPSPEQMNALDKVGLTPAQLAVKQQQAYYYQEARKLAAIITEQSQCEDCPQAHVVTGGGPGIMEAANRGAADVGGQSIGLNIVLPHEQAPNEWITPELCFQFHYFAIRKMHFLLRARALVVFPGGFGTLDELFETLTLIQTRKIEPLPVIAVGKEFWGKLLNLDFLVEQGMIHEADKSLFHYVDSAEEAWELIRQSLDAEKQKA